MHHGCDLFGMWYQTPMNRNQKFQVTFRDQNGIISPYNPMDAKIKRAIWHISKFIGTIYKFTIQFQYKARLSSYAKRIWFLANAFAPAYGNTQTCLKLLWIGLRIWNAFGMNQKFTLCVCLISQIWICDLWAFGGFSFIKNSCYQNCWSNPLNRACLPGWFITWLSDNVRSKASNAFKTETNAKIYEDKRDLYCISSSFQ